MKISNEEVRVNVIHVGVGAIVFGYLSKRISFSKKHNSISSRRKVFCFIMGTLLFLIAALRSESVGSDTVRYISHFNEISAQPWSEVFKLDSDVMLFYIVAKIISLFTSNAQWFLAFVALVYSVAISVFIYKNSKDAAFSFLMLIPFMYFAFSMTGLKQTMAISLTAEALVPA